MSNQSGPPPKADHPSYLAVARFPSRAAAGRVYQQARDLLFANPAVDLSAYRFALDGRWHVAILGDPPPTDLEQQLTAMLAAGESSSLPAEILNQLVQRRAQATQLGTWVEGHHRPGTH